MLIEVKKGGDMSSIDIDNLRTLTAEAIKRGQKEHDRKLAEERLEVERKRKEEDLKAESIISQIPSRAETEARVGRSHAIVMGLGFGDYDRPLSFDGPRWDVCKSEWLKGAARKVYERCVAENLGPTLEYWYSGDGMNSGFNIVIHW